MGDHAARGGEALRWSEARSGGEVLSRDGGVGAAAAAAALEAGRRLFAQEVLFVAGVAEIAQLPPPGLPEIAFAGRSNVGKSSLINALTGQKQLARTSQTPGRTRALNFFALAGRLALVDLPGYGYAKAPKREAAGWQRLFHDYLRGRPTLRRVILLVDARHGLKPSDEEMMERLDAAALSFQIALTKSDQCGESALEEETAALAEALRRHPAAHPEILATSAKTGRGIASLRAALAALAAPL